MWPDILLWTAVVSNYAALVYLFVHIFRVRKSQRELDRLLSTWRGMDYNPEGLTPNGEAVRAYPAQSGSFY